MTSGLPTGTRGRLLALGLTFSVLASLWLAVANPLIGWYGERAEALELRRSLERRMADLAAGLPRLREQAAAAAGRGATSAQLLEGATDAIAAARLQELLQDMARQAGTNLNRVETVAAEPRGVYTRVGLRLAVAGPWPSLVRLLRSIDEATPRMLVDELQLRGTGNRPGSEHGQVEANFIVFAFRAAESKANPKVDPRAPRT
jgi:general secretion pathway protein M